MKVGIISLGWLGKQLHELFTLKGDEVWGTYAHTPKGLEGEVCYNINEDSLPKEALDSEWIIFNLPPSKLCDFESFKKFLSQLSEQKLLFVSSTSVYGQEGDLNEDDNPIPTSENGKFLLDCEKAAKEYGAIIVRPAGLFGAKRHPGKHMAGRVVNSDPEAYVNLVSGEDVCSIISELIETKAPPKLVNAVNINHPQKGPFYSKYCKLNDLESPIFKEEASEPKKRIFTKYLQFSLKTPLI